MTSDLRVVLRKKRRREGEREKGREGNEEKIASVETVMKIWV